MNIYIMRYSSETYVKSTSFENINVIHSYTKMNNGDLQTSGM